MVEGFKILNSLETARLTSVVSVGESRPQTIAASRNFPKLLVQSFTAVLTPSLFLPSPSCGSHYYHGDGQDE